MAGPEATIERECRSYALAQGVAIYKVKFADRRGCPDRLVSIPADRSIDGCVASIWCEFKAPGGSTTPHQEMVHAALRRDGFNVQVIDNVDRFKEIISALTR